MKFTNGQNRYCTTKKELQNLILALQYFDVYVAAAGGPITVFMNNKLPLTFLFFTYVVKKYEPYVGSSCRPSFFSTTDNI